MELPLGLGQRGESIPQTTRIRVDRVICQVLAISNFNELAGIHDCDAISDLEEQRQVVRHENDRESQLFLKCQNLVEDLALHDDIDGSGRLIHHDQFWIACQRQRDQ